MRINIQNAEWLTYAEMFQGVFMDLICANIIAEDVDIHNDPRLVAYRDTQGWSLADVLQASKDESTAFYAEIEAQGDSILVRDVCTDYADVPEPYVLIDRKDYFTSPFIIHDEGDVDDLT